MILGDNAFGTALALLLALAVVAFVIYLSYLFSKFVAKKVNNIANSNNIKIVERVSLTQDKGLAIVEIGQSYFLVGFSTNTIEILQELNKDDLHFPAAASKPKFIDELTSQIKSRLDLKISVNKDKQQVASAGEKENDQEEK